MFHRLLHILRACLFIAMILEFGQATQAWAWDAPQPTMQIDLTEAGLYPFQGDMTPIFHSTAQGQLVLIPGYGSLGKPTHALISDNQGRSWRSWDGFSTWPEMAYADVIRRGNELLAFGHNSNWGYTGTYLWRSNDEGLTWTGGDRLTPDTAPWAPVNQRVLLDGNGRLIVPVEQLLGDEGPGANQIGTIYSDDGGQSWTRSAIFGPPAPLPDRPEGFGEPAVVELANGKQWMVYRTRYGRLWQAWSNDNGASWQSQSPTSLVSPLSSVIAKRIPGTNKVITLWNNATPGASENWGDYPNLWTPRSPMVFATSGDNCQTWSQPVVVDTGTAAYPSVYFLGNEMFLSYWEDPNPSAVYHNPDSHLKVVAYDINTLHNPIPCMSLLDEYYKPSGQPGAISRLSHAPYYALASNGIESGLTFAIGPNGVDEIYLGVTTHLSDTVYTDIVCNGLDKNQFYVAGPTGVDEYLGYGNWRHLSDNVYTAIDTNEIERGLVFGVGPGGVDEIYQGNITRISDGVYTNIKCDRVRTNQFFVSGSGGLDEYLGGTITHLLDGVFNDLACNGLDAGLVFVTGPGGTGEVYYGNWDQFSETEYTALSCNRIDINEFYAVGPTGVDEYYFGGWEHSTDNVYVALECDGVRINLWFAASNINVIIGDANLDGTVDANDAAILATNWQGSNKTWADGDFNGDGTVDDADATLLASNWQTSQGQAAASIPEPSSLVLLSACLLCLSFFRYRRRWARKTGGFSLRQAFSTSLIAALCFCSTVEAQTKNGLKPSLRLNLSKQYHLRAWQGDNSPVFHRTAKGDIVLLPGQFSLGKPPHALASRDEGRTWRNWESFQTWPKVIYADVIRLKKELLAFGHTDIDIYKGLYLWRSRDEGATWTGGNRLTQDADRYAPMNQRVLVTGRGRLIVPVEQLLGSEGGGPNLIGTIVSDDAGKKWQRGPMFGPPPPLPDRPEGFGEPSVVEFDNGQFWMVFRTRFGHLWQAWSNDGGLSWGKPTSTGMDSPLTAVAAKRIPGSNAVVMVWDNSKPAGTNAAFGAADCFWWPRSPLALAISRDQCKTWSRPTIVDTGAAAQASVFFSDKEMFLCYWSNPDPKANFISPNSNLMLVAYELQSLLHDFMPAGGLSR